MKAEIICVGTELLLGQILNSNAQYLSQRLAEIGVDCHFQTVVGDNTQRISEVIEVAKKRADLLVFTGGLGPTPDDLTKEAIASTLGYSFQRDEQALQKVEALFASRGVPMPPGNEKQADYFAEGIHFPNSNGLAVGAAVHQADGLRVAVLPGPPSELKPMVTEQLIPWLISQEGQQRTLISKTLRFAGIGESMLVDQLRDLIDAQIDPTIAPYAHDGEVSIRLSTKVSREQEAEQIFAPMIAAIQDRVGEYLYAFENIGIEEQIVRELRAAKWSVACAESCSGGLLSDLITDVAGVSDIYKGGIVSYQNETKRKQLQIPEHILDGENAPGAISIECAEAMAKNVQQQFVASFGLATTGNAGPSSAEDKPIGLVYVAIAMPNGQIVSEKYQINGNRQTIKRRAAKRVLYLLWREMKKMV